MKGTLLVANEGINGTIAGTDDGIFRVLSYLRSLPEFANLEHKESRASKMPFLRMKVRLKKEIVTMGVEDIDPNKIVGTYVDPKDWNDFISHKATSCRLHAALRRHSAAEARPGARSGAVHRASRAGR